METVIIVIHLMVILALIAVVLLQRSEGGALGVGGGGDQFMTARGQGNVLTRATTILAAAFFATSLLMGVLTRLNQPPTSVLETAPAAQNAPVTVPTTTAPATTDGAAPAAAGDAGSTGNGILNQLDRYTAGPSGDAPSTTAPDTSAPAEPATGSQSPTPQ